MTAVTLGAAPSRALRPRALDGAQRRRPSRPGMPTARVRLTRRGRLAITAPLCAAAVAASLFAGGVGAAGTQVQPLPVRYVTVAPGQTLWSIAGEVAPQADRRDTVERLLELNALDSARLIPGQRLAVPTS